VTVVRDSSQDNPRGR